MGKYVVSVEDRIIFYKLKMDVSASSALEAVEITKKNHPNLKILSVEEVEDEDIVNRWR